METINHYGRPCGACVETHYGESSLHIYGTQQSFLPDFPFLVAENCHRTAVVQKIVCQVGAKASGTRTQSKAYGVSIGISLAVP